MRSARNQLILLGFIGQAFSWDDYFLPLLSALLWFVCLKIPRKPIRLNQLTEFLLIWVGIALGHFFADAAGKRLGLFVCGYGLTLVQAARLLRPLNRSEKIFSVLVACFQIGVASTIVLDYRFIFIFIASLVLIPKALVELESESYPAPARFGVTPSGGPTPQPPEGGTPSQFRFGFKSYAAIILATAAFYILFPRGFGPQLLAPRFGSQEDTTLLDSMIDPTRGGSENDDRVLLQIEGEQIGYLRCFALVDFDGQNWTGEKWDTVQPLQSLPPADLQKYKHRRVRVKNSAHLGKILPTDGAVDSVTGKFFRNPSRDQHGIVKSQVMWNSANNFYEYWMDSNPQVPTLGNRPTRRLIAYPPQSERLQTWLEKTLEGTKNPLEQARLLENFFKRNFTYKIGAPRLSRANTADDFIFNQREGHCERFATHLALLLRMKGIPSRVMVGYLPNAKSWFTGRYNVRFRDAHAWTEAWFQDRGWVLLDATPAATTDRSGNRVRELLDALDFMWYSKVVALDAPTQTRLLTGTLNFFSNAAGWLSQNKFYFLLAPLLLLGWFIPKLFHRLKLARIPPRQRSVIVAEHCYGQMLRLLAKKGFHREPQQTPLEFLCELEKKNVPFLDDAQLITKGFCATRYGSAALSAQNAEMENSLRRLKKSFSQPERKM